MSTQTTRNSRSIRTLARAIPIALILTFSLGGAAQAGVVSDLLYDIRNKINQTRSWARTALNRLPDDGVVRELFRQVDPAVVSRLMGVVSNTKDVLQTLEAKRAGFDAYKNGGGADRMRGDLKDLFESLRVLSDTSQKLRCFQDPETSLVPMQVDFMSQAVDRMPPVVLFGIQKVLDEAAPDWRTKISDILDDLPVDAISDMCGAGADFIDQFETARCTVTREMNQTRMVRTELKAKVAGKLFKMIQKFAPEDVQFSLTILAVGGGGAGTNVTLPLRGILQAIINVMEKVESGAAKIQSIQKACSAADEKMERDLLSCTALASYDEKLEGIRDLALRRLESLDAPWASFDQIGSAQSFGQLCTSYREFRIQ